MYIRIDESWLTVHNVIEVPLLRNSIVFYILNLWFILYNLECETVTYHHSQRCCDFVFVGQKGIGFKSVFRVTDSPEIHSAGFHIRFDVNSGPLGYILPHWVDDDQSYCSDEYVTELCITSCDLIQYIQYNLMA